MTKARSVKLEDLNATTAHDKPHEFEYIDPAGEMSGMFFRVLGREGVTVSSAIAKLVNERRKTDAARMQKTRFGQGTNEVVFDRFEDDLEHGQNMAAVRLVGWRGPGETDGLTDEQKARFCAIDAPCTPENALKLCRSNSHIAAQITNRSDFSGNFIKL